KYRSRGRQRWFSIGRQGAPWTPDGARKEARRLLGLVAAGKDPATAREADRAADTMSELAKRFMSEHVTAKRKGRTADGYQDILDRLILPRLGRMKTADVTRADVAKLHHALRATPYQANRALAVLSKMFNLAEVWGERL